MKPLCIYHGNCADGFTAAWVVRKALGYDVDFHAGIYGNSPPDVRGRDVVMVDFSYKRPVLLDMARATCSLLILDHHKTAAEDLSDIEEHGAAFTDDTRDGAIACVFDMQRSGAGIAWDYFFPNEPRPALINHIEDRDLWRFALANTREIQANVFSHPYDFELWDELMARPVAELVAEGKAIERKHFKDIAELTKVVTRRFKIGGYEVPVANLPYTFSSDAGLALAQNEPFAACYYDTPEGRCFSLRSTAEGLDVSEIAKQYGGGGHRNASGFRVPYGHELAR